MSAPHTLRTLTVTGALLFALAGCKQGEGEPCDVASDCEDGFVCCGDDRLPEARGVCQPAGAACDVREIDAGVRRDAGAERDGGADAGTGVDAGVGGEQDAGTDAGGGGDAGGDAGA